MVIFIINTVLSLLFQKIRMDINEIKMISDLSKDELNNDIQCLLDILIQIVSKKIYS